MVFKDRVAIVTGSTTKGGIGAETAGLLAEYGCSVVIVGRNLERGQIEAKRITDKHGRAIAIECDVSKEAEVKAMVEKTLEEFGKIDILVQNAGIRLPILINETTEEEWDNIFSINLTSMFIVAKAVVPHMVARQYGRIVNVSSLSGKIGGDVRGGTAYSATKAAVSSFTRTLAAELYWDRIRVNSITLGGVDTPMVDGDPFFEEMRKRGWPGVQDGLPKGIDVARYIAYLVNDENTKMVGEDNILGDNALFARM